jgi:hypothetical protein
VSPVLGGAVAQPAIQEAATVAAGHFRDTREQDRVATTDHHWQKR